MHGHRGAPVEGPAAGAGVAFGVDLVIHGVGDRPRLLATAFVDEGIDTQGQGGAVRYPGNIEIKVGLVTHACQRDIGDLPGVVAGSRQGERSIMA
ncbi:hypothetical protein D3C72_2275620 [compost metagenome]